MAQHKYAQTGLLARTRTSGADVMRMAEATASSQQSDFFRGVGPVTITSRSVNRLELAAVGGLGNKFKQMTFTLSIGSDGSDTTVRTKITWYRTSQNTIMGFIPAGPKLMVGYKSYELFLNRLKRTLEDADRTSQVQISPTADSSTVPVSRRVDDRA